jgi:hypothetical protein
LSATYFSDGRTLNGTIWLSDPINDERHNDYLDSNLNFSMEVFTEDSEGNPVNDYNITIYPQSDGTWIKEVREYEPDVSASVPKLESLPMLTTRILESAYNYTGFYKNSQRYIDMSVNLETIGLPDEYFVGFHVNAINKNGTYLADTVLFDHAPPTKKLTIYSWPDLITVRAGEEITRKIPINTTDLNVESKNNLTDMNKDDNIMLNFDPQLVELPKTGIRYTTLTVKAGEDAYKGNPTLTNQTVNVSSVSSEGISTNLTQTFDLEILPPFTVVEKISNSLRNNPFSYLIPIGITSLFAIWLSRRIQNKNYDPERIRVRDIITVDASVIAGVLIFLTVGSAEVFSGRAIQQVGILTASIVFPFAIASIITLIKGNVEAYGIKFMISGFVYLMVSVILIAFIQK